MIPTGHLIMEMDASNMDDTNGALLMAAMALDGKQDGEHFQAGQMETEEPLLFVPNVAVEKVRFLQTSYIYIRC